MGTPQDLQVWPILTAHCQQYNKCVQGTSTVSLFSFSQQRHRVLCFSSSISFRKVMITNWSLDIFCWRVDNTAFKLLDRSSASFLTSASCTLLLLLRPCFFELLFFLLCFLKDPAFFDLLLFIVSSSLLLMLKESSLFRLAILLFVLFSIISAFKK